MTHYKSDGTQELISMDNSRDTVKTLERLKAEGIDVRIEPLATEILYGNEA